MSSVKRVTLDVLKPHEPDLLEFAAEITAVDGVAAVNVSVIEIDKEVQNVTLAVEGDDLDFAAIEQTVTDLGCSVHSVDEVAAGEYLLSGRSYGGETRATWLR